MLRKEYVRSLLTPGNTFNTLENCKLNYDALYSILISILFLWFYFGRQSDLDRDTHHTSLWVFNYDNNVKFQDCLILIKQHFARCQRRIYKKCIFYLHTKITK